MLAVTTANAQMGVFSQMLKKGIPIDTAQYSVTYSLNYSCHPYADIRFDDIRTVLIGGHSIKDFSDIIHHFDSICTEQYKRGADSFTNPPGSPWPYEILLSDRGRLADMKYRLPFGVGILHYSEPVPTMQWHFVSDSTMTILGLECQQAITEFAGRKYSAWFTSEIPLPYGPYKFGGLPGLILRIQDAENQFVWEATAFRNSRSPINVYEYEDQRPCSAEEATNAISRCYKRPNAFQLAVMGGHKGVYVVDKDGKTRDASEIEDVPIPYIPLER